MNHYLLDENHKPYQVDDLFEWAHAFEKMDRHVAVWELGNIKVSTVFLGLNHNHGNFGPPILFETMVFGMDDDYQERCCTWEQAKLMHDQAVQWVQHKQPNHKPHEACYYCQEEGFVHANRTS